MEFEEWWDSVPHQFFNNASFKEYAKNGWVKGQEQLSGLIEENKKLRSENKDLKRKQINLLNTATYFEDQNKTLLETLRVIKNKDLPELEVCDRVDDYHDVIFGHINYKLKQLGFRNE